MKKSNKKLTLEDFLKDTEKLLEYVNNLNNPNDRSDINDINDINNINDRNDLCKYYKMKKEGKEFLYWMDDWNLFGYKFYNNSEFVKKGIGL